MAETINNKIYYQADKNVKATVLDDMKKLAESTDKAIEVVKEVNSNQAEDIMILKEKDLVQNEKISTLEKDNSKNKTDITTNKSEIEELKLKNDKLKEENNHLINQIPQRKFRRRKHNFNK